MRDGEGLSEAERMEHLERTYFQAQRSVEDLLDDLGVDRALRPRAITAVPLGEALMEAAQRESFRTQKKQQRFELPATVQQFVQADRDLLVQLLAALLSNASKFSPRSAVIHVQVNAHDDTVELTVADPGVGIAADELERVFERFVITGSRSTDGEPQARGTLARARQWARAMGGELQARSPGAGCGSTFVLTLPAATPPRA
jgi:signal transduction histidine kinase